MKIVCNLLLFFLIATCSLFFSATKSYAATRVVNSLLDDGDTSCTEIKCTFRDALTGAANGDVITFSVTGTIELTQNVDMLVSSDIDIVGPGQDVLTIDSNGGDNYITFSNLGEANVSGLSFIGFDDSVFYNGGGASSVYTFTDVVFSDNTTYGPVYANNGDWNFNNVIFRNNLTDYDGGVIYFDGNGQMTIENSTFENNLVGFDSKGGAIHFQGLGSLSISNTTFENNSTNGGSGGVISFQSEGNLDISDSSFTNNESGSYGGVIHFDGLDNSVLTIDRSTFQNNADGGHNSGGVYFDYGLDMIVTDSTFSGNTTYDGVGGAIAFEGIGDLIVTNSTFNNNTSFGTGYGGAIYNFDGGGDFTISNSTFVNNPDGGGYGSVLSDSVGGLTTIKNSTFYNDSATENNGIWIGGDSFVVNSIFSSLNNDNCYLPVTSGGHNIDTGSSCGFNQSGDQVVSAGQIFESAGLANNGGQVKTVALKSGSAAINTANDAYAPTFDARGFARVGTSDIGAFEYQQSVSNQRSSRSGGVVWCTPGQSSFCRQPELVVAAPVVQTTPKSDCPIGNFSRSLRRGMSGQDVYELQKLLNCLGFTISDNGLGSPGNETNVFAGKTHKAVVKFQEVYAQDILKPLNLMYGTGLFGQLSRKKAVELSTKLQSI